jgi:hypothetical protein
MAIHTSEERCHVMGTRSSVGKVADCIKEGKSPDDKKNSAFSTKFFANFHYFYVLFPSSRQNSTKPQHLSMRHYIAKLSVESSSIFYGNLMLCINWFY